MFWGGQMQKLRRNCGAITGIMRIALSLSVA